MSDAISPLLGLPERCVILLIGLPGAGKSTYLRDHGLRSLSTDELRLLLFDDENEQRHQDAVFSLLRHMLRTRLKAGRPRTFVDATSLSPRERRPLLAIAEEMRYECAAIFFDVSAEVCLRRNRVRGRQVPEAALLRMAAQLRPPATGEGFLAMIRVDETGHAAPYLGVE